MWWFDHVLSLIEQCARTKVRNKPRLTSLPVQPRLPKVIHEMTWIQNNNLERRILHLRNFHYGWKIHQSICVDIISLFPWRWCWIELTSSSKCYILISGCKNVIFDPSLPCLFSLVNCSFDITTFHLECCFKKVFENGEKEKSVAICILPIF